MTDYELRPVDPGEVDEYVRAVIEAFHRDPDEEEVALWRRYVETDRTLVAFHDGAIVATSGLHSMRLAVPGGTLPMAGISAVGVQAVHRGRGLFDRMIRGQLEAIRDRGREAIAGLWASEAGLYDRYGFGLATRLADLTISSPDARLRTPVDGVALRAAHPPDVADELAAVYDRVWSDRPGLLARRPLDWEAWLSDLERDRKGAGRLRAVLADRPDGPAGYALFAVRKQDGDGGRPGDVVELLELQATDPRACAALWEHLLGLSLTRTVRWDRAPEDEPLPHMLTDARAVTAKLLDALQIRLVDVPRALTARTYAAPVDVVLDVSDPLIPGNAGRWRLAGDGTGVRCERTDAAADLALAVTELGAAYLGGTSLATLAAAGRVEERSRGALAAASRAFAGIRAPWAMEEF
jgi:predicted acetyltransferase